MKITLIILIVLLLTLTACKSAPKPVEQKEIIRCTNLIFDCSNNDCADQCGVLASENNKRIYRSQSVNNGEGCECTYILV